MKTIKNKTKAFAFLGAAFVLLIALTFTACPNAAGGGGNSGGGDNSDGIEGVWKALSTKSNDEEPVLFPETQPDNSTLQPYFCFSEGKMYIAGEIARNSNSAGNGLFKAEPWEEDYTFANGTLTFAGDFSAAFSISGNTATMTVTDGGDTTVTKFERVSSPTVAEIKAAKAPFVENGAVLILSPNMLTITVKATTSDGTSISVEGCNETTLTSGVQTTLTAKDGRTVTLIGKITELDCTNNRLTDLNVQGLSDLQKLSCGDNKLTALDVRGLSALQSLSCSYNQLTALNVQGCTALQELYCMVNKLTELNMQGYVSLQKLSCGLNELTALNVQGLSALKELECFRNKLTALNVQGCSSLEKLHCYVNRLTTLNVQNCTALKDLNCFSNQLNADVFTKLFTDLPTWNTSDGAQAKLYSEKTSEEGNCKDFSTPQTLKDAFENAKNVKHWKMQKWNTSGNWEDI